MPQETVLIVEDDAIVAVHLRNMLIGLGYSVTATVATGELATAVAADAPPDLIMMDIELAGEIDGISTAERILNTVNVPIIFLTSYSQDSLLERAKTVLPYGYLIKPVSQKELVVAVEIALYRHRIDQQLREKEEELQKAHDDLESRVQVRTADLVAANKRLSREMEERRRIDASLQESNRMLQALSLVQSHYISGLSMAELFRMVLADFILLTDSKIGFIGEVLHTPSGGMYIKTYNLTDISWDEESREIYRKAATSGVEFRNPQTLFGAVMKTGKVVIANDPATDPRRGGLPKGHPALGSFLGLPIHYGTTLVGVVGLANCPAGYDEKVVEYLQPFLMSCGNIIEAQRNRQRREVAEDSLRESEERYRRITEGLTDYLYRVRLLDGRAVETIHGPACEMVTGYTPEDYAADPGLWRRMILPDDQEMVTLHIQRTLAGENIPPIEHRIIHKNGQIRWVRGKRILQYDSSGKLVAYDGVLKDITEQKRAQEALHESEEKYRTVADFTYDWETWRIPDGTFQYVSPSCYRITGHTAAEFLADPKLLLHITHPDDRQKVLEYCQESEHQTSKQAIEFDFRIVTPAGEIRWIGHSSNAVYGKDGQWLGRRESNRDITQARLMDRQLIQSEKLASLGLLIAGVAHEINNPNNFIYFNAPILRSYLQFLLPIADEYALSHPDLQVFNRPYADFREDCFKLLDNIEHGSTRINQIVGNLREFARQRGKGEKRRIDLKVVVEKGLSICLGRIKKLVKTIDVHIPDGFPALISDPLAIEQIVVNLMVNAAHAADKDDSWVRLTIAEGKEPQGEVVIEVSDNGCGMDSETKKKIFDPFFTTKAVGVGTGLGLSISHRLVTEIGGRIEVESEVGRGSVFRVVLKRQDGELKQ